MKRSKFCLYLKYALILSFFALGVALVYGSVYMRVVGFDKKIAQTLALKENSTSLKLWLNPPANIYRKFYMFNVTNPKEVLGGKKPILQECGPYTYREVLEKRNLEYLDDNRVKYTPVSTLYFEPELSNGTELDTINFINLLEFGVASKFQYLLKNVFIKKTVKDLIAGYNDNKLLPLVSASKGKRIEKFGLYSEWGQLSNFTVLKINSTFKISLKKKNGTELFEYVAATGSDDINKIGKLESWKGKELLDFWATNYSNAINGSDGSKYPPNIQPTQTLSFFNPDLCRSLQVEFLRENVVAGVQTLDFHLAKNIFSNDTLLNPNYYGFCPKNDCLNGTQSLRECRENLPIFASLPHFLNADPILISNVIGLNPDPMLHDFIMSFDPLTGTSIKSNLRVQFNFYLKKIKNFELLKKANNVMIPMFWLELEIDTFPAVKEKLAKYQLIKPILLFSLALGSAIGCAASVAFIFVSLRECRKKRIKVMVSSLSLDQIKNAHLKHDF